MNILFHGTPISKTASGTTAATATVTGAAEKTYYVTDVTASSDLAGSLLQIKNGSTVIWEMQVGVAFCNKNFVSPLACTLGSDLTATINGTSACYANVAGFSIP